MRDTVMTAGPMITSVLAGIWTIAYLDHAFRATYGMSFDWPWWAWPLTLTAILASIGVAFAAWALIGRVFKP